MQCVDIIVENAHIVTLSLSGEITDGTLVINKGNIIDIIEGDDYDYLSGTVIDAEGDMVLPGFIDCHTHLVHAGSRAKELYLRRSGVSYQEILRRGGGIHSTVRATRAADIDVLYNESLRRAKLCLRHGTTTAEIKTGYGLEPAAEKKMFDVIRRLGMESGLETVPTFLGAHVYPEDRDPDSYLNWLLSDGISLAQENAEFADIYCDTGAYSLADTERYLRKAKENGLALKIHSGQFETVGASGLAAELSAISADHLDHVAPAEFDALLRAGTIPVFLPGCSYYMQYGYPDARPYLDAGMPVALATDYNPGTCPSLSLPMIMSLAVMHMNFTPMEALRAITLNAAGALKREKRIGSLEKGKQADLIIVRAEEPDDLIGMFGCNLVQRVIKNGKLIVENT